MSGWSTGYVSDVPYIRGFYRQQSPLHLDIACLLGNTVPVGAATAPTLSYLELGCGQGYGALALAASHPNWRITAVDLLPAHIADAREFAAEAGIGNAAFIEADLVTLTQDSLAAAIPEADVVSMHGLWAWVTEPVRAGIVRLLRAKLRPGGMVHISYNALPGWQGTLGMQRLLRESGLRLARRSDRQAAAGLEIVRALFATKAVNLVNDPFVKHVVERNISADYLSHEYMNVGWSPCFHADVAAALAEAKLDWVASAELFENFTELMLDAEQREIMNRFDEPGMRELVKDLCVKRGLRQDLFVRGARRLDPESRDRALRDMILLPSRTAESFDYAAIFPAGKADLEPSFYGPVTAALATGPKTVGDLLDLPDLPRRGNPAELIGMLVGTEQAVPAARLAGESDAASVRFNVATARRLLNPDRLTAVLALASSRHGATLPTQALELFVWERLRRDEPADPAAWADRLTSSEDVENRKKVLEYLGNVVSNRVPVWRSLHVL
ncbi:MAG: class I SAM-dependent methyltransferase [Acidisphaera sp.]|nr:class I SAM-dependent methyltransferase [Acidisphaera sp.]